MAISDYKRCDVCSGKTFYDATLSYDFDDYPQTGLPGLGAWAVLCEKCAKTHVVTVVPRFSTAEAGVMGDMLREHGVPEDVVQTLVAARSHQ